MVRELEGMGFKFEEKELDSNVLADYRSDFRYGTTGLSVVLMVLEYTDDYNIHLFVKLDSTTSECCILLGYCKETNLHGQKVM